jgi:5'-phosphate synthase pdxT subunit
MRADPAPINKIGVLALQGAFHLHKPHIEALGAEYVEITRPEDLGALDGLILPGGESGVMLKLIDATGMQKSLSDFLSKKPAWGICAGAILMAKKVTNPDQPAFGAMNVEIERNAYGRQLESIQESIDGYDGYDVSYIRAPRIARVGSGVDILSRRDGSPTWVESGLSMMTTFHPETNLAAPSPWHRRFAERCGLNQANRHPRDGVAPEPWQRII